MLGLKLATDPRWADIASMQIEDILTDHAYCEQKAATNGISMIILYPEYERMVETVAPIVSEEWTHFRMVLAEIKKRGYVFGKRRPDKYVIELFKLERKGGNRDQQITEKLMISAMIEARSCERFRLLSTQISDLSLRDFYHEFMVSEAGHYVTFIDLAKEISPEEIVKQRWEELLLEEAEILNRMELRGDRMH